MKSTTLVSLCLLSLIVLFSCSVLGQPAIGIPPFSSIQAGPADAVNLGNLNVNLQIPIVNKAGRGLPFAYMLAYDNSIWYPVTSGGTQTWHPVEVHGDGKVFQGAGTAYISYSMTYSRGIAASKVNRNIRSGSSATSCILTTLATAIRSVIRFLLHLSRRHELSAQRSPTKHTPALPSHRQLRLHDLCNPWPSVRIGLLDR